MVNDEDRPQKGQLRLSFVDSQGEERRSDETAFEVGPLGAQFNTLLQKRPAAPGL